MPRPLHYVPPAGYRAMLSRADRKTKNSPPPQPLPGCHILINARGMKFLSAQPDMTRHSPGEDCPWPGWLHRAVVRSHFWGVLILLLKPLIWLVHFRVWSASVERREKTQKQLSPLVTKRRRVVAHDFGAGLELLSVSLFSLLLLFFPFRFFWWKEIRGKTLV